MKYFGKITAVLGLAAVLLVLPLRTGAQDYSSSFFKVGVKGGINFSSMSRFSSSVTQNFICIVRFLFAIVVSRLFSYQGLGCSQQAFFGFRGRVP